MDSHKVHSPDVWPPAGLEFLGKCPICGSSARDILYRELRDLVFFCAPGTWTLHQCRECRSAYLDPRPSKETVGLAYTAYYTHRAQHLPSRATAIARWKTAVRNGYMNYKWGMRRRPAFPFLARICDAVLIAFPRSVDESQMRGLPRPASHRRLLDVGCGNGEFLGLAREAGWRTMGLDFDSQAVAAARKLGLDVREGGIDLLSYEVDCYDALTLSHVIEHVHEPLQLLSECRRLLKPGGYFWIETPNVASYGHRAFGRSWRGLEPPRHLILFSGKRLKAMLEEAGFKDVQYARWRPEFEEIYLRSLAIRQGRDPYTAERSLKIRAKSRLIEVGNAAFKSSREFLTFTATK